MATKQRATRKAKKGKKLRKVKKLEATKPLDYYKIHLEKRLEGAAGVIPPDQT